jgi:hypothetical protein
VAPTPPRPEGDKPKGAQERDPAQPQGREQGSPQKPAGEPAEGTQSEEGGGLEALEEAHEKGYLGETPDDRPNEEYTVEGVTNAPDVDDPEYAERKEAERTGRKEGEGS